MRLVQAGLAAVGAFWSELIPAPSLWDYEGAALADREAEIDSWEPDGLLGREPSHADYDDEPRYTLNELFDIRTDKWNQIQPLCAAHWPNPCECFPSHQHEDQRPCWCESGASVAVPVADEPPGGIEVPALPPGLPFTFNVGELITTATKLISQHYRHNGGRTARASEAAELVVSQLVADLTAAYTEAQK